MKRVSRLNTQLNYEDCKMKLKNEISTSLSIYSNNSNDSNNSNNSKSIID